MCGGGEGALAPGLKPLTVQSRTAAGAGPPLDRRGRGVPDLRPQFALLGGRLLVFPPGPIPSPETQSLPRTSAQSPQSAGKAGAGSRFPRVEPGRLRAGAPQDVWPRHVPGPN